MAKKKEINPLVAVLEVLGTTLADLRADVNALYHARVPLLDRLETLEQKVSKLDKRPPHMSRVENRKR